jgi:uncharacterized membrane protein YkvA (DUF1232 family)
MSKILYGEILKGDPEPEKLESDERRVRSDFWKTLRKAASKVPFTEDLVAGYYCALDPQTPMRTRAILLGALAYFVLPLDWVPDFIIGFGFTDDVAVLAAAIGAVRSSLKDAHYSAARKALSEPGDESRPERDAA